MIRTLAPCALLLASASPPPSSIRDGRLGFSPAHLDTTCAPCDDFYRFANGGWIAANPVPDDRSSWSAYAEVEERTRAALRVTLVEAAETWETAPAGSGERKLGVFFACCMDSERVEREGIAPLRTFLSTVEEAQDPRTLSEALGRLHAIGVGVPFELGATADPGDASMMIAELGQGGLTLPVSDWYRNEGADFEALREDYRALVRRAFELLGRDEVAAGTGAAHVLELETSLAGATMSREAQRDPARVTNRMSRDEVHALIPSIDWTTYFEALGVPEPDEYNVRQPEFLREVDHLIAGRPPEAWRDYFTWWLVRRASRFLDSRLAALHVELRGLWSGSVVPPPRVRMCESLADFALGETLGRQWARATFPPPAKAAAEEMVSHILTVFRDRIEHLEWMTPATRREALAKLRTMDVRIGYPNEPFDHGSLELDEADSLLEMVAEISRFRTNLDLSRIGGPDPDRWALNPQRLTGAYIPARNAIEYPAAKFQPPFFDAERDDAMNYGAIGATIAHEITHALDDEGRHYDAGGNLRDWWTAEDAVRFEAEAERLVEQFDGYVVLDSVRVNGALTLGENIADLGGVTLAYHAWRRSLNGTEPPVIDGTTGAQRFFLAWAHNWRETIRPEELRTDVERDVHAPSYWRVNGPLSNLPEFARAWSCGENGPMVRRPDRRVRVW